jgi:photosystem II oxygen-evolving enhancer protein 3
MALMAGCQAVLEGSLQLSGSNRFSSSSNKVVTTRSSVSVRAQQQQQESSRRAVIGLVATGLVSSSFVQAVLAEAIPIKVGGPPAPSGGLRMYSFLID